MVFYFVDVNIQFSEHENNRKGFQLGEGVVAVAVFAGYVRFENVAFIVIK